MRALGFGDTQEAVNAEGKTRQVIGLRNLPANISEVKSLPPDILNALQMKR